MSDTPPPLTQGLQLDERQRAMLAEMGVRLWWPEPEVPVEVKAEAPARSAVATPARAPAPAPAPRVDDDRRAQIEREEQHAGGRAVQPVGRKHLAAELVAQPFHRDPFRAFRLAPGMDDHPRRLVDIQQS